MDSNPQLNRAVFFLEVAMSLDPALKCGNLWRPIQKGYVSKLGTAFRKWIITMVIVSPLTGVVGPFPNSMAYKAYNGGDPKCLLDKWDDPPRIFLIVRHTWIVRGAIFGTPKLENQEVLFDHQVGETLFMHLFHIFHFSCERKSSGDTSIFPM